MNSSQRIFIFLFVISFTSLFSGELQAAQRNLLGNSISKENLAKSLTEGTNWVYTPGYTDRTAWESLAPEIRQTIIQNGEKALSYEWETIKATDYIEYLRSGSRNIMQDPDTRRTTAIKDLALAELVEGKGRFLDQLINGVWTICEQSTWVLSAHLPVQKGGGSLPNPDDEVIDLGSGRTAATIAWIHYYFEKEFDKVSPFIAERIRREIRTRILAPYYTRNDFWWMGFDSDFVNNWNVWVNYNILQCILLIETDQQKRIDNVYKAMTSIDKFINYYPDDGGCDEGPSYWSHAGGKLFECLELLQCVSDGKVNIYSNELIKNMGRYIYRAYIGDPYFVNFADASAKGQVNPGLVYRYGKAIEDPIMQGFGTFYGQKANMMETIPSGTLETVIHDLFDTKEILAGKAIEPLIGRCWLPQSQFAVARDKENSKSGFFFAVKGGHNNESHNHNDVGTFILYYNSLPVLIDAGVGTYTRQTFSSERYSIWTMQSGYHNLPVINGNDQQYGKQYASRSVSFKSSGKTVNFSLDISGAYAPDAAVKTWKRDYTLNRNKNFIINDSYSLSENKGKSSLHFMTACLATVVKPGMIRLDGDGFSLELIYNPKAIQANTETINIEDPRLQTVWGNSLTRLSLDFINTGLSGRNTIEIKKVNK